MSINIQRLLENNRRWAKSKKQRDPDFFSRLVAQQTPRYFWLGCSDSRIPANEVMGVQPGQVFVHRNVGNILSHHDLNGLSTLQYAVDVLQVEHILLTGHYGCGAISAALGIQDHGIVDNWIRAIRDIYMRHKHELEKLPKEQQHKRLCELNVIAQVNNICHTRIVQNAWQRGQNLAVHGWMYCLENGHIHDLQISKDSCADIPHIYLVTE